MRALWAEGMVGLQGRLPRVRLLYTVDHAETDRPGDGRDVLQEWSLGKPRQMRKGPDPLLKRERAYELKAAAGAWWSLQLNDSSPPVMGAPMAHCTRIYHHTRPQPP